MMPKIIRIATIPLSLSLFCRGVLKELSQDYEVIALSSPGPLLDEIADVEGVRTVAVKMSRHISPLSDLRALMQLVRIFRRERPDMVHSMTPKAGLLAMAAAKLAGVKIRVHTFTGLLFPTTKGIRRLLFKISDSMICACATHLLPEGEGVKQDLVKAGITHKELQVLGNGNVRGIDLEYYCTDDAIKAAGASLRTKWGIKPEDFVFVFVGRIVRDKGIVELAKAFERLSQQFANVHLVLVGMPYDDKPLDNDINLLLTNNLKVYYTNQWVEDVRPYYAAAQALVFPSHREGFPNVVLEAGAMQLPSLVTDINGSREIIDEGYNGFIITPCDVDVLVEAMTKLMLLPSSVRMRLAENARTRVVERYDQKHVRNCLKQFYAKCLNSK